MSSLAVYTTVCRVCAQTWSFKSERQRDIIMALHSKSHDKRNEWATEETLTEGKRAHDKLGDRIKSEIETVRGERSTRRKHRDAIPEAKVRDPKTCASLVGRLI